MEKKQINTTQLEVLSSVCQCVGVFMSMLKIKLKYPNKLLLLIRFQLLLFNEFAFVSCKDYTVDIYSYYIAVW